MDRSYSAEYDAIESAISKRVMDRPRVDGYRRELTKEVDKAAGLVSVIDRTIGPGKGAGSAGMSEDEMLRQILSEGSPWVSQELFELVKEVLDGVKSQAEWDPPTGQIALALVLLLDHAKTRSECGAKSHNLPRTIAPP